MDTGFVDAHLHITDFEYSEYEALDEAELLFSCSADRSDWIKLKQLSDEHSKIIPFYGIHPWFLDSYDISELEKYLIENPKAGVGEIGLDGTKENMDFQKKIFSEQLNLAGKLNRVSNVHMVRSEQYVLEVLRSTKHSSVILHSFKGPESYINAFVEEDCYFSISPNILSKSEENLKNLLVRIPKDRLLIETDAPNNKRKLCELISVISSLVEISEEELVKLTANNAKRLLR